MVALVKPLPNTVCSAGKPDDCAGVAKENVLFDPDADPKEKEVLLPVPCAPPNAPKQPPAAQTEGYSQHMQEKLDLVMEKLTLLMRHYAHIPRSH